MTTAGVKLWGTTIGAVTVADDGVAEFAYDREFLRSGIEVSPITMPLAPRRYRFPELSRATFHGLPGLLADALPDRFGNAIIDVWLAGQGRDPGTFDAVERLCYTGTRGTGALEFHPTVGPGRTASRPLDVGALRELAARIVSDRASVSAELAEGRETEALTQILKVGTSAGGARPKAVVGWNPTNGELRSGQTDLPDGFEHWLLKFDGAGAGAGSEFGDPQGYGAIEFAYSEMARAAGIEMTECRLLAEGDRRHFMTRRFDRLDDGSKVHMQSLGAIAHYDFNHAGGHSYEQALAVCRRLELSVDAREQLFRRMVFNLVARNQDDHVKNIAFLMDRRGRWHLSPAYDVTYAFNPSGDWTSSHQMTVNSKRDRFTLADLQAVASAAFLSKTLAAQVLDEVREVVDRWPEFAERAAVEPKWAEAIGATHRLAWE